MMHALTKILIAGAPFLAHATVTFADTPLHAFPSKTVVLASTAGAALDSNLLNGGGTDDTAKLQAVLDRAAQGRAVHLIIEGPALVSGLNVYGNTTIECTAGGGLYLKDNSSRAILRNARRSRDAVMDEHITVHGCFLNGNRNHQPSADVLRPDYPEEIQKALFPFPSNKEPDGTYISGLQFMGIRDLAIEQVTLWNIRAFGVFVANGERITVRDVTVDHGGGPNANIGEFVMTDGLHFKGPLRHVNIDGVRIRAGDDALAFNADDYETDDLARRNDFGPYVRSGPITDVTVTNVQFMDTLCGIRLLSAKQRIDRIAISNVSGTLRGAFALTVGHWMNPSAGNIGSVLVSDVLVDREAWRWWKWRADTAAATEARRKQDEHLRKAYPIFWSVWDQETDSGSYPFISINAHVENLVLRNVMTKVADDRPILRLGGDARVQLLTAELRLLDPKREGVPVKLDAGARVDRLNLLLQWEGGGADAGRNPITDLGASIGQLHWIDTAPLQKHSP